MKFSVSSKTLHSFASAVSKVINSKNALTVLDNFLFILDGNTLTIKATDTENAMSATLEVSGVEGSGSFCLDAHKLVDLLKEMPDQGITFDINDETYETRIESTAGFFIMTALSGADYPQEEQADVNEEKVEFDSTGKQILHGIDNTLFAVSTDSLRPQMTGILWDIKPDCIIFVATDTRKLVKYTNATVQPGVECSFILPPKPANVLKGFLAANEENVHVVLTPKSLTFVTGPYRFTCRLIKGRFPDYNRVIPANNPNVLNIDRQSLLSSVKRVTVVGGKVIKFKLDPDSLVVEGQELSYGTSGKESLKCSYEGQPLVIGFDAIYLQEITSTISTKEMLIKFSDQGRPAVCYPSENKEQTDMLILLMPMNIG